MILTHKEPMQFSFSASPDFGLHSQNFRSRGPADPRIERLVTISVTSVVVPENADLMPPFRNDWWLRALKSTLNVDRAPYKYNKLGERAYHRHRLS